MNEIWVTAQKSAKDGVWNERLKDDRAFVTALKHLAAASITACAAIVKHRPGAIFITSETAEYIHESCLWVHDLELEMAAVRNPYGRSQRGCPVWLDAEVPSGFNV